MVEAVWREVKVKIKNINGTVDKDCKCGGWLQHWDRFSGQEPTYCPVQDCMTQIEIAAHVQKDSLTDNGWYIIPLCQKHNAKKGESLNVNENVKLVSANVKGACA
jgi:hypothetical protein